MAYVSGYISDLKSYLVLYTLRLQYNSTMQCFVLLELFLAIIYIFSINTDEWFDTNSLLGRVNV